MFTALQVILLAVLVAVWKWHMYNPQCFYYGSVVTVGVITGLIMGNVQTGMLIGGTFCLMSLGLFGAGGSSVPDYQVGAIAGTAFAIAMGQTGQDAVATAMAASDKHDWKGMGRWMWLSQIPFLGLWVLPIVLLTTVGAGYVEVVIHAIPVWLNNGLKVASGMLPALGFAILMHQLPMKKYGYFLLFGFVLAAYLNLSVLAIAMMAIVFCAYIFQQKEAQSKAPFAAAMGGDNEDE